MIDTKKNGLTAPPYTLEIDDILAQLDSSREGITSEEAKIRLSHYGLNQLKVTKHRSSLIRFFSQFHNALIYILIIAACATFLLGKYLDTVVISALVIIDALIGFYHEGKAEHALEAVKKMLSPEAHVMRDKRRISIPAEQIVPGDVIMLQSGDKVPADMRLIQVKNLQISEAILTGESLPVEKNIAVFIKDTPLGDQANMVFSGTLVTYGQALGVVVTTGKNTQLGQISEMLSTVETLETPLLRKMTTLGRWLSGVIILMTSCLFFYGYFIYGYRLDEMFIAAVSIAVAAIPEGLPIILTVTLSIGVQRMAKRHAIIRRLPAVETLGSVSVICSDKTGTLTRNELTVQSIALADETLSVTGVGYFSPGEFFSDGTQVMPEEHTDFLALCKGGILCNTAEFHLPDDGNERKLLGDPTEGALLALGSKAGLDYSTLRKKHPLIDSIPFESEHRFMATLHHDTPDQAVIYVKGAPEAILARCTMQQNKGKTETIEHEKWHNIIEKHAQNGERVLAIAYKPADYHQEKLVYEHVSTDLILLGIVGMMDPPREEVIQAVRECIHAGILVKMITGDHASTALAIAHMIGIADNGKTLTGAELDSLDDNALKECIAGINVFARAAPEHKLRLIKSLQSLNHVIAMTGDGVNDAPALKRADIGVAMGIKGTEVAKESSEMVLTDDNFASIVAAVKEGRTVFDNLKKAISFLLPINGGESLSLIVAILFGFTLPISPIQILWVNMVSSVTLGMSLAFEPHEPGVMQRPPVQKHEAFLTHVLVWRIVFVSLVFLAGIFGVFQWGISQHASLEVSRTLAVNALVILEVFYLFSSRYIHGPSLTAKGIRGTPAVLIAVGLVALLQFIFTYTPVMHYLFNSQPLNLMQAMLIILIGIAGFFFFEAEKLSALYLRNIHRRE